MTSQHATEQSQHPIGMFSSQEVAENARNVLRAAGFAEGQVSIEIQALDPNPDAKNTQASRSAGGGAIAGTLFGAIAGLLLTFMSLSTTEPLGTSPIASTQPLLSALSIVLAGSGVGAIAGMLLGALSGINIPKEGAGMDRDRLAQSYLINVQGTEDELRRAKDILRQQGSEM